LVQCWLFSQITLKKASFERHLTNKILWAETARYFCQAMIEFLKLLRNPNDLILYIVNNGGLYLLMFIIFAETGLFAGFFLPGDSLLFVAGIYAEQLGQSFFGAHYLVAMLAIIVAAIVGNIVGYWFGYKSGPFLYQRKDSFFFKKKHLITAKNFFDKQGSLAIIMGRFLPFVRTFAPIVAGIVKVPFAKFLIDSIIGAVAWVCSMMLAGRFLHKFFLERYNFDLTKRIELIALGIIIITTGPVIWKFVRESRRMDQEANDQ
jgi:membrane-associated protein